MLIIYVICVIVVTMTSDVKSRAALVGPPATSAINGELCRTQCQSVYKFYRQFIEEPIISQYLVKCLAKCPDTISKTTETTPSTRTSPRTTAPTTMTSTSTTTTPTTRTSTSTATPTTRTSTSTATPTTRTSTLTTTPTPRTSTSTTTPTTITSTSTTTQSTSKSTSTTTKPTTGISTSTTSPGTPTTSPTAKTISSQECGVSYAYRDRVANGVDAKECQYPWMAHVTGDNGKQIYCGASIIDSRHVITAAHCVRNSRTGQLAVPSMVNVSVGSSDRTKLTTFQVSAIIMDPRYNFLTKDYDIAVLKLSSELSFSDCVQPICLPSVADDPTAAEFCEVAGWGLFKYAGTFVPTILQRVTLPLVDQQLCKNSYSTGQETVNDLKLCAGDYYQGGIDACSGDSGGPLMCLSKGRYLLFGIVSFGKECGLAYYPGVYTRVNHPNILEFINLARGS